jgi:hypothetical protein
MLKMGLLWHLEEKTNVFRGFLLNQFSIEEIESKEFFLKGLDFIIQAVTDIVQTLPRLSLKYEGSKKKT